MPLPEFHSWGANVHNITTFPVSLPRIFTPSYDPAMHKKQLCKKKDAGVSETTRPIGRPKISERKRIQFQVIHSLSASSTSFVSVSLKLYACISTMNTFSPNLTVVMNHAQLCV